LFGGLVRWPWFSTELVYGDGRERSHYAPASLDWSRVAASSLRVVTPVPPSLILGLLPGLENRMPRPVADLLGGGDGQTTPM
jgi:hypothetical protein